jgi:hypothetical protein
VPVFGDTPLLGKIDQVVVAPAVAPVRVKLAVLPVLIDAAEPDTIPGSTGVHGIHALTVAVTALDAALKQPDVDFPYRKYVPEAAVAGVETNVPEVGLLDTECHSYVMPETAVGCKLVKSTVVVGQTLLLLVAVGTTALGVVFTVRVVVAGTEVQPDTVCVKLTV